MIDIHLLVNKLIHLDDQSEKFPNTGINGHISWAPGLKLHPTRSDSYFIQIEWRYRLVTLETDTIFLSFIYLYGYEIFFKKDQTTYNDLKLVINDSYKRFVQEFDNYKKDKNFNDVNVTPYNQTPIDKWVKELIEVDLPKHNLI